MIFEWDHNKNIANQKKHEISFFESISVFKNDPNALSEYDENHSSNEDRWITLGLSDKGNLLIIIHSYREVGGEEKIRIISVRKADKNEENQYNSSKGGYT